MNYHIAQFNVARMIASLDDAVMRGFVDGLEPINTMADEGPGFIWRLKDDGGAATSIQVFEDEAILVNMSVWESMDALKEFVYRSAHLGFLRNKKAWFQPLAEPSLVLWWVRGGHIPTIAEGKQRLELLRTRGPSSEAFTFSQSFPVPTS